MTTFGERLKDFRIAAGWSQPQLAENSGVPVGTIRDYEQGRRAPLLETAAKLARALKHPLETFLRDCIDAAPSATAKRTATDKPAGKKKSKKKEP